MNRLEGKVAIITGAASGMGLAAAKLFAEEGAKVVAVDIKNIEAITALENPNILGMQLDVSDEEGWNNVAKATEEAFGKIDVLVNNAGLQFGPRGILDTPQSEWDTIMNVDLKGSWLGMKAVIPYMQKSGGGSIINTSSTAGLMGGIADGGSVAYAAAKGGVRSLTKHAANVFGKDGIRVNTVCPGTTMTGGCGGNWDAEAIAKATKMLFDATPLAFNMAEPIDMAYIYLYLASDESRFATGAEFVIDGGLTSH